MLSRLRARLTYSNVMSTLALFVALGGSAYAVGEVTSRDIRNRTIKGGDIRLNTVTGREIRESRLGRVPSALNAENAAVANLSRSSDTATTAQAAGVAENARALAGQGAEVFERSSRTQFGRAAVRSDSVPAKQTFMAWPELGVNVQQIAAGECTSNGGELGVTVTNTRSSGNLLVQEGTTGANQVAPSASRTECTDAPDNDADPTTNDPDEMTVQVTELGGANRTFFVQCFRATGLPADEIRCLGVRSEP